MAKGRVHVLGDALSRAPQTIRDIRPSINTLNSKTTTFELPSDLQGNYDIDCHFGPIRRAVDGNLPEHYIQSLRPERLLPQTPFETVSCTTRTRFASHERMSATFYMWHATTASQAISRPIRHLPVCPIFICATSRRM